MYAVIATGGKQYRVSPGDVIYVEKLPGEQGTAVEFDKVLAVSTDTNQLLAGEQVAGVRVRGAIQKQTRGEKLRVFKFKRKKQYKRTIGHRQHRTAVQISEIVLA
ncbi:MAG: 50S ribosomal protein L21 [Bryobacteraceae bacterium]|nr:50S ribosomal protein L21 [Bryobacteraceae bacterium]MDW8378183.1 50S ribosomal protein L21 [Bryobacterales bacterium]